MTRATIGSSRPLQQSNVDKGLHSVDPRVDDDEDGNISTSSGTDDDAVLEDDPLGSLEDDSVVKQRKKSQHSAQLSAELDGSVRHHATSRSNIPDDSEHNRIYAEAAGSSRWQEDDVQGRKSTGTGRRVAYDDLTAIDWIFEYTKEKQRLHNLHLRASSFLGQTYVLFDSGHLWLLLILTGIATGVVAAGINTTSDWLGDLKTGYCQSGEDGGRFYLNKSFCCYGYDELAQCRDWVPWSQAMNVASASGVWFVEYVYFLIFSVSDVQQHIEYLIIALACLCNLCWTLSTELCILC